MDVQPYLEAMHQRMDEEHEAEEHEAAPEGGAAGVMNSEADLLYGDDFYEREAAPVMVKRREYVESSVQASHLEILVSKFNRADADKGGTLTMKEFRKAFGDVFGMTKGELQMLYHKMDANLDGGLDLREFIDYNISDLTRALDQGKEEETELREYQKVLSQPPEEQSTPHRMTIVSIFHIPQFRAYLSVSREGTLVAWQAKDLEYLWTYKHRKGDVRWVGSQNYENTRQKSKRDKLSEAMQNEQAHHEAALADITQAIQNCASSPDAATRTFKSLLEEKLVRYRQAQQLGRKVEAEVILTDLKHTLQERMRVDGNELLMDRHKIHHEEEEETENTGGIQSWSERESLARLYENPIPESRRVSDKTAWINDCCLFGDLGILAVASADFRIHFYELDGNLQRLKGLKPLCKINCGPMKEFRMDIVLPARVYSEMCKVPEIQHVPLCMDYGTCSAQPDTIVFMYGDDAGVVSIYAFSKEVLQTTTRGLVDILNPRMIDKKEVNTQFRQHVLVHRESFLAQLQGQLQGQTKDSGAWITQVAYLPDLHMFAASFAHPERSIVVAPIDDDDHALRRVWQIGGGVNAFLYIPIIGYLIAGGHDAQIRVFKPTIPKEEFARLEGHHSPIIKVAKGPDPTKFMSMSADRTVIVWDLNSLTMYKKFTETVRQIPANTYSAFTYDDINKRIVTASAVISAWHCKSPRPHDVDGPTHEEPVVDVVYEPLFGVAITMSSAGVVTVWDPSTGERKQTFLDIHNGAEVTAMTLAGRRLATADREGRLKIWNFVNGQCLRTMYKDDNMEITAISFCYQESFHNKHIREENRQNERRREALQRVQDSHNQSSRDLMKMLEKDKNADLKAHRPHHHLQKQAAARAAAHATVFVTSLGIASNTLEHQHAHRDQPVHPVTPETPLSEEVESEGEEEDEGDDDAGTDQRRIRREDDRKYFVAVGGNRKVSIWRDSDAHQRGDDLVWRTIPPAPPTVKKVTSGVSHATLSRLHLGHAVRDAMTVVKPPRNYEDDFSDGDSGRKGSARSDGSPAPPAPPLEPRGPPGLRDATMPHRGGRMHEQGHKDDILAVAYREPNYLATAGYGGEIVVWNINSQRRTATFQASAHKSAMAKAQGAGDPLELSELRSESAIHSLLFIGEACVQLNVLKPPYLIATGGDGMIRFWYMAAVKYEPPPYQITLPGDTISCIETRTGLDGAQDVLFTGDSCGRMRLFRLSFHPDRAKAAQQGTLVAPTMKAYMPRGSMGVGAEDAEHTGMMITMEEVLSLTLHDSPLRALKYADNEAMGHRHLLLSAADDHEVRMWRLILGRSASTSRLEYVGHFGQVARWDLQTVGKSYPADVASASDRYRTRAESIYGARSTFYPAVKLKVIGQKTRNERRMDGEFSHIRIPPVSHLLARSRVMNLSKFPKRGQIPVYRMCPVDGDFDGERTRTLYTWFEFDEYGLRSDKSIQAEKGKMYRVATDEEIRKTIKVQKPDTPLEPLMMLPSEAKQETQLFRSTSAMSIHNPKYDFSRSPRVATDGESSSESEPEIVEVGPNGATLRPAPPTSPSMDVLRGGHQHRKRRLVTTRRYMPPSSLCNTYEAPRATGYECVYKDDDDFTM